MLEVTEGAPRRLFGGAAALAMAAAATAAEPPAEPARPDFLAPAPAQPFRLPPVAPFAIDAAAAPMRVDRVTFTGNTVVPTSELEALAQPYVGRSAGAAEVEELRQAITRLYIARGYVSSGALLLSAANGVLAYRILEGRLVAVRLRGLDGLDERYVASRLARDADGPFNADVLRERFQILLGDPLFARMNARLVPGAQPGDTILDVDIERAPAWQATLYANNHRPPSIGAEGIGVRGWRRDATGFGDVIEGSVEDSAHWDSGVRMSLGGKLPVNAGATVLSGRYDRGRSSVVEEPLAILGIKSVLESAELGIGHTLVETLRTKASAGVSFVARENRTWLLGTPFSFTAGERDGRTRTAAWRFWQEYTHRSESEALVVRSTLSYVRNDLEQVSELDLLQPGRRYRLWLGQAQYARRISEGGLQLVLRATLQRTGHRLLPLDALPLGGVASVRGYRENQLIRDTARIMNAELEWPVFQRAERRIVLTLVPFYDYAHGSGRDQAAATLSSVGIAARGSWHRLSASLAVAKRLVHPAAVGASRGNLQDHGVHFEAAWSFN